MTRFDDLLIGGHFATDVTTYDDFYPGDEDNARIVTTVSIAGSVTTQAIVDTGAPWCILHPELAESVGIRAHSGYEPSRKLFVRGISCAGRLHRVLIGLRGEKLGNDLEVEATVFVPDGEWPHPNFLGLSGLLDRIRFAIDPAENAFYFGPL
mgnify:CR=1 FL=1